MLALNCGKIFSAEAQTFNAMAVTVILPPASCGFGRETGAQLFQFRDVGFVLLGDVRNGGPRFPEMLGRFAPHAAHGNALDFSEFGEIGKLRLRKIASWRGLAPHAAEASKDLGMCLHVVFTDASTRAGALYVVNVHADFSCQTTNMRRRGSGCPCSVPATLPSCAGIENALGGARRGLIR